MATFPREEIEATLQRYLEFRRQVDDGERDWVDLCEFFTDDAVFVDPVWGRVEGLDGVRRFLVESMAGLEDWKFPVDHVAFHDDVVFVKWRQVLPSGHQHSGVSTMVYAGGGKFRYEEDQLNMAHVMEDLAASGWTPPDGFHMPPRHPNRDFRIP